MKTINSVLIANRGEIAVRVIRACRELDLETIVTVSEADRESMPAKMADRTVCIGPPQAGSSYLQVNTIVAAALGTGADAIHPGYGFLAEQPELPEACQQQGLVFIGPPARAIRRMGDKLLARQMVKEMGIPVIPGSELVTDYREALTRAEKVGFPILLKAAAGGGGRGIKVVARPEELATLFQEASAEALGTFGDDRLYVEHLITNARHIEVQIIGDRHGRFAHLFERDCSLQRRYQKLLEEAPSPVVKPDIRAKICEAALTIARNIGYENAGTLEFLLDRDQDLFYFLEMNTRIQVEHPVTEMITGIDLVREQIRVAAGLDLGFAQSDVHLSGHALECRINAESPAADFRPSPGVITDWRPPSGEGIRVDTHCYTGYLVPPFYDSLLAKLIAVGRNRTQAMERMRRALDDFTVTGVDTTIPVHGFILNHPDFRESRINTRWIENTPLKGEQTP